MEQYDINCVKLDYLTLTSYSLEWAEAADRVIDSHKDVFGGVVDKGARWENYKGRRWARGVFLGAGHQGGKRHYALNISGEVADSYLKIASGKTVGKRCHHHVARCTRVDIQCTIPISNGWDARLVSGIWQEKGVRARLAEGTKEGMDTIYIGTRQSAYLWRIYVKEDMYANRYLRFELELRKKHGDSTRAWEEMTRGVMPQTIAAEYMREEGVMLTSWVDYDRQIEKWYDLMVKGGYVRPSRVLSSSFVRWLDGQVSKAIENRMNDETIRPLLKEWLERVVEMVGGKIEWLGGN